MTVESKADREVFIKDFGIRATLYNGDGQKWDIKGIFDNDMVASEIGGGAGLMLSQPHFICLKSPVPEIKNGQTLKVENRKYRIIVIDDDFTGFLTLSLQLKDNF